MTTGGGPQVKATATSTYILEALIELDGATGTAVAEEVGLSKSSVHNHLETLTHLGFVVKEDRKYRASLRFLQIGAYVRQQFPLFRTGTTEVKRLVRASGLVAGLAILERDQCICIHNSVGQKVDKSPIDEGETVPLHCTAPGKAVLAELPREDAEALLDGRALDSFTEQTITDRSELIEEIETIQSRELAVDREEWETGLRGIAAGINGRNDELLGALYVMSPADSMLGKRFQQDIPGLVISSANQINKNLHGLDSSGSV